MHRLPGSKHYECRECGDAYLLIFNRWLLRRKQTHQKTVSRLVKNYLFCHSERSEGSQLHENKRFFVALRMTVYVVSAFFDKRLVPEGSESWRFSPGGPGLDPIRPGVLLKGSPVALSPAST